MSAALLDADAELRSAAARYAKSPSSDSKALRAAAIAYAEAELDAAQATAPTIVIAPAADLAAPTADSLRAAARALSPFTPSWGQNLTLYNDEAVDAIADAGGSCSRELAYGGKHCHLAYRVEIGRVTFEAWFPVSGPLSAEEHAESIRRYPPPAPAPDLSLPPALAIVRDPEPEPTPAEPGAPAPTDSTSARFSVLELD